MELPRLLSKVEGGGEDVLKELLKKGVEKLPLTVGVAGPPGAGKSTLIGALARELGKESKVGVIALDPSSPYSGGSILGDRIRMRECESMEGVYIRSVASESERSLPPYLQEMILSFSLFGFDYVFIETPGIGQTEVAIKDHVDRLMLVIPPYSGDDVQFLKSGILEVSDCYVVNKADLQGAKEVLESLKKRVLISDPGKPVFMVSSRTGEGIPELLEWVRGSSPTLALEDRLVLALKDRAFWGIEEKLKGVNIEDEIKRVLAGGGDNIVEEVVRLWLEKAFS